MNVKSVIFILTLATFSVNNSPEILMENCVDCDPGCYYVNFIIWDGCICTDRTQLVLPFSRIIKGY